MDQAVVKKALQDVFAPLAAIEELKARDYLKPSEVERIYPLPASTLEKKRRAGCGPRFIKQGKSVYYRHSDIKAYLDARVQKTSGQ